METRATVCLLSATCLRVISSRADTRQSNENVYRDAWRALRMRLQRPIAKPFVYRQYISALRYARRLKEPRRNVVKTYR